MMSITIYLKDKLLISIRVMYNIIVLYILNNIYTRFYVSCCNNL